MTTWNETNSERLLWTEFLGETSKKLRQRLRMIGATVRDQNRVLSRTQYWILIHPDGLKVLPLHWANLDMTNDRGSDELTYQRASSFVRRISHAPFLSGAGSSSLDLFPFPASADGSGHFFYHHLRATYLNDCKWHGQRCDPDGLIFEQPSELINAAMEKCIAGDCVAASRWQRLTQYNVVIRSIGTAASNLQWDDCSYAFHFVSCAVVNGKMEIKWNGRRWWIHVSNCKYTTRLKWRIALASVCRAFNEQ